MTKPLHVRKIFFEKVRTKAIFEYNKNMIAAGNCQDILVAHNHSSKTKLCNGLFCIVNDMNYIFNKLNLYRKKKYKIKSIKQSLHIVF